MTSLNPHKAVPQMADVPETLTVREPEGGPPTRGTVIVIAGRGEQPEVYRRFATRLAFDAYRVHVVGDAVADPDATRRQITAVLDGELTLPVVLVGSDAGAWLAAALAAADTHGTLNGVILAGLPVGAEGAAEAGWDDELDARTTCPTHRGRISQQLVTPGALYAPLPPGFGDVSGLEEITVPTLVIHGQDDPISSVDEARDALPDLADLEFVTIADARHDVLNNASHRTVAAAVVTWLERVKNGGEPIATTELRRIDRV